MVAMFMGKIGAPIYERAMMYKAVVYAVLLYGSERCVVIDAMMKVIELLHNSKTYTDCGDESNEGQRRRMGLVLGGRGIGYHGDVANMGVSNEASGKNRGICDRKTICKLCTGTECMEGARKFIRC